MLVRDSWLSEKIVRYKEFITPIPCMYYVSVTYVKIDRINVDMYANVTEQEVCMFVLN